MGITTPFTYARTGSQGAVDGSTTLSVLPLMPPLQGQLSRY